MKDYSHVPLSQKLGIKPGTTVVLDGAPDGVESWLEPLPDGARVSRRAAKDADVIVCFATRAADLARAVARFTPKLAMAGGLWLCYPKRTSGIATDATFDVVQRLGLDAALVDNKSISVSPEWSGMRFVRRLRDRSR